METPERAVLEPQTITLNLTLTQDEFQGLILMAGMVTGAAYKGGFIKLARAFLTLANQLNKDNPNWIPYFVEEERNVPNSQT